MKADIIELPYLTTEIALMREDDKIYGFYDEQSTLNMYLIVPEENPNVSIDNVVNSLTPDMLAKLSERKKQRRVKYFTLPKFKMETDWNLLQV